MISAKPKTSDTAEPYRQQSLLARRSDRHEEAIAINSAILREGVADVVALNRLGRAYASIGNVDLAKKTFRQVLQGDPKNSIASRRVSDLDREHP